MVGPLVVLLLSLTGLIICRSISFYSINRDNKIVGYFCKVSADDNCHSIMNKSRFGKDGFINLGDIGLFYFSSIFVFVILSFIVYNNFQLVCIILLIPSTCSILFSLILILYQKIILKSWCKLCLTVLTIVWALFFVDIEQFLVNSNNLSDKVFRSPNEIKQIGFLWLFSLLVSSFWFLYKKSLSETFQLRLRFDIMARWRSDPDIFFSILSKQNKIDDSQWEDDLILGKKSAKLNFISATNLYCPACAQEFLQFYRLLNKYPNDIKLIIRLHSKIDKPGYNHNLANNYIVAAYQAAQNQKDKALILYHWFRTMNLTEWRRLFPTIEPFDDFIKLKSLSRSFFANNTITSTPSLFLNGYSFPKGFTLTEFDIIVDRIIEKNLVN